MEPQTFPLTNKRWDDFEQLFGPRGACAGCWCMYWKIRRKDFSAGKGDNNRLAQKEYVASGKIPGLIVYVEGIPAGWVAVESRENFPVLNNSRILKPVDENPVWSIACFFIARNFRNKGLTVCLIRAATKHVEKEGGKIVEAYPVDPLQSGTMPPVFVYTGLFSAFKQAGFMEVARRSERRPVMRFFIKDN
jgi:hypothetical protein